MFSLKKKKKVKGFTLIEILLVVGFIALAGIGVYVVYDKVQATNAANQEVKNIKIIIAETKAIVAASGITKGTEVSLTRQNLINLGVIPENMIDRTAIPMTVRNSFGVEVPIVSVGTIIQIQYLNVPQNACLKIVTGLVPDVDRINIAPAGSGNGAAVYQKTVSSELNMALAATNCNGSNPKITVVFSPNK